MPTHATGLTSRKQAEIDRVVRELGDLNDRRKRANENNDLDELERVAAEYEARGMVRMAGEIRMAITIRKAK